MSRVTPPVKSMARAVRGISSSAHSARSSIIMDSPSRYLPQSIRSLKAECATRQLKTSGSKSELVDRLTAHDIIRQQSTLVGNHRPNPSAHTEPSTFRFRPLMQTFRTSAPKAAANDTSTIDFFFFPDIPPPPPLNPFSMRVPLLPDNYNPDRSAHPEESLDEAVPQHEVHVVASHPEDVLPASMSEVVGNDGLERSLEELTRSFKDTGDEVEKELGAVRQILNGVWDDFFGETPKKSSK